MEKVGKIGESSFRVFLKNGPKFISPWHDISWNLGEGYVPFVCEIPAGRTEKMEVCLTEKFNPILQDTHKNGKLRYWSKVPKFNYGMIPQTFEDPNSKCPIAGIAGDGDPIDVVDVARNTNLQVGSVVWAKVLASFCLIDKGEADWKILVSTSPTCELTKAFLEETCTFFETYKIDAKNYVHNNRQLFNTTETWDILDLASKNYMKLVKSPQNPNDGTLKSDNPINNIWIR